MAKAYLNLRWTKLKLGVSLHFYEFKKGNKQFLLSINREWEHLNTLEITLLHSDTKRKNHLAKKEYDLLF